MNAVGHFLQEMSMLFLMASTGYVCRKRNILGKHTTEVCTQLLLYITLPAFIVYSLNISFHMDLLTEFLWLISMSAYILFISSLLAAWLRKRSGLPDNQKSPYEGLIIFGNQGFIGYAISFIIFGEIGVTYATIFNICYFIFIWTYGIYIFSRGDAHIKWRNIVFNSGIIATITGLALMFTPFSMPAILENTLETIGKMTIPLSMIMIGSLLAEIKKDEYVSLFTTSTLWISAGAKLFVIPFLLFPFIFLNVPSSLLVLAALISGMPSAPTISLFSYKYGANANYASLGVFLSTLLSMMTIPALYWAFTFLTPQ